VKNLYPKLVTLMAASRHFKRARQEMGALDLASLEPSFEMQEGGALPSGIKVDNAHCNYHHHHSLIIKQK
jgi:hypothetical protein